MFSLLITVSVIYFMFKCYRFIKKSLTRPKINITNLELGQISPPEPEIVPNRNDLNTVATNPEVMNYKSYAAILISIPIFCLPTIQLHFFTEETSRVQESEFSLFWKDLLLHIFGTIIWPLINYTLNPRLRKFIISFIENYIGTCRRPTQSLT